MSPRVLAVSCLQLLLVGTACGYFMFQKRIPNGNRVPHPCIANHLWHGVGHENVQGGGTRNPFGMAFAANGYRWDATICNEDSDGDGKTNGEELGDPSCTWREGDPNPSNVGISHPGVCEPLSDPTCMVKNDWEFCNQKDFECEGTKQPDVLNVTLKLSAPTVPQKETTYYCQAFDLPDTTDFHIIADKPFLDNRQIIHHMLLYGCPDESAPIVAEFESGKECEMLVQSACSHSLAGWTVGGVGDCFDGLDAGTLIGRNGFKKAILEVHWNNPFNAEGQTDSSGMTLFYTPNLRTHNLGVLTIGPMGLVLPDGKEEISQTSTCSANCTTKELPPGGITVVSAGLHMHYLGTAGFVELRRNGEKVKDLAKDEVFRYDSPVNHNHNPGISVMRGDELHVRCVYTTKDKDKYVYYGDATADEMCFAFLSYYPKIDFNYCVQYGNTEVCDLTDEEFEQGDVGGCRLDQAEAQFTELYFNCDNTGETCTDECLSLLQNTDKPCLSGDARRMAEVDSTSRGTAEDLEFVRISRSCDRQLMEGSEQMVTPPGGTTPSGAASVRLLAQPYPLVGTFAVALMHLLVEFCH